MIKKTWPNTILVKVVYMDENISRMVKGNIMQEDEHSIFINTIKFGGERFMTIGKRNITKITEVIESN